MRWVGIGVGYGRKPLRRELLHSEITCSAGAAGHNEKAQEVRNTATGLLREFYASFLECWMQTETLDLGHIAGHARAHGFKEVGGRLEAYQRLHPTCCVAQHRDGTLLPTVFHMVHHQVRPKPGCQVVLERIVTSYFLTHVISF